MPIISMGITIHAIFLIMVLDTFTKRPKKMRPTLGKQGDFRLETTFFVNCLPLPHDWFIAGGIQKLKQLSH
jgi:hypothetical protein